jgi:hypothetical protein
MPAVVFTKILQKGADQGLIPARTQEARDWFRTAALKTRGLDVRPNRVIQQSAEQTRSKTRVGGMFLFQYDPKTKADLPYYDSFPLIFPIEPAEGGFLGINLHYLPLRQRAILMDALFDLANNESYDNTTRLRLSYNILKRASRFRLFEPCLKRYLYSNVESRLIQIPADQWDIALFLPLERFAKANKATVWTESLKKTRKQ